MRHLLAELRWWIGTPLIIVGLRICGYSRKQIEALFVLMERAATQEAERLEAEAKKARLEKVEELFGIRKRVKETNEWTT